MLMFRIDRRRTRQIIFMFILNPGKMTNLLHKINCSLPVYFLAGIIFTESFSLLFVFNDKAKANYMIRVHCS